MEITKQKYQDTQKYLFLSKIFSLFCKRTKQDGDKRSASKQTENSQPTKCRNQLGESGTRIGPNDPTGSTSTGEEKDSNTKGPFG